MNAEISMEVVNQVEEAQKTNPERRIPVIVTFEPGSGSGSDVSSLESEGLHVDQPLAAINAVSGTIPASHVTKLAQHPGIMKIEYDGEVRALKTD